MIHNSWSRFLPTLNGSVMKEGGSLNLAKGQLGVFDVKKRTKDGIPAISDFAGLSQSTQLQLRVGNHELAIARTQGNKNKETRTFKISEIEDLEVFAPDNKKKVDELIVGYDGIDPETALTFEEGDNDVLNVLLSGDGIGDLNEPNGVSINTYFKKTSADQTNQEIVEKAVQMLKDDNLKEGVPVTEYLDISVINSENPATVTGPVSHTYYSLTLVDAGDSNSFANVQSQYNFQVKQTDRVGLKSTYKVLRPTADGAPSAFVSGIGSVLKGCEDCPTGFTAEDGGFIYYVSLEDDGADSATVVETIANAVVGSAVKQGQKNGVGIYAVAVTSKPTKAEVSTFVTANPTAVVDFVGETADICNNATETTTAWVAGDECNATTDTYTLQLADDDCGANVLAEVQETYPDLTITVDSQAACQTVYTTDITTNIVCEECDPIFRKMFESEAPDDFGFTSWEKAEGAYSETALMGIRLKGKETISNPPEYLKDTVPFINSSIHIEVAGGFYTGVSMSYKEGGERFPVKVISRAQELTNLGGTLWGLEDRDFTYFEGYSKHSNNEYAKNLLGEESVLKANAQYVIYNLKVAPKTRSQGFAGVLEEGFTYMVAAEVGKHQEVEAILNHLAGAAGIPPVVAYGA